MATHHDRPSRGHHDHTDHTEQQRERLRAFGAIRERIPGGTTSASQGVTVEVGETQAAVDLEMAVEYGVSIVELSKAVRRNVITSLERTTGLEVVEVNVIVSDVHLPTDDDGDGGRSASEPAEQREPRVQ